MSASVYLNGIYLPLEQACVSVLDRGFLFGDGAYELVPVFGRRPFRLRQHLDRFQNSLDAIRIRNPLTREAWSTLAETLIADEPAADQALYLQVTRGVAKKRDHAFPADAVPTVFAMSSALPEPDPSSIEHGLSALTVVDIRWHACHVKAITLLANVLARQQALDAGGHDAILLREGYATEGAASNLFIVRGDTIVTPPKNELLLPGITRDLLLQLLARDGMPYREAPIAGSELARAQEIWLSSSSRELVPVTQLDGAPVGSGRPGAVFARVLALYRNYKERFRRGEAE
jgi:D-alanine transaminase